MYYITKQGHENLYEQLSTIDQEIAETNKRMGESVRLDNDLRENPEFMELRVKSMYELPRKKEVVWNKYQEALIIEETEEYKKFDQSKVIIGSTVFIDFDGESCKYTILGTDEGNLDADILSCEAPIAKILIGKQVGETVTFNGMVIKIKEILKYKPN